MQPSDTIRLRGNKRRITGPWPLGEIPKHVIINISKMITHRMIVGMTDITGDDFGNIFADAIGGGHLQSPVGLADVVLDGMAWSIKTVQNKKPFSVKKLRFISGRNSPGFSSGIDNPHENIHATGKSVLGIWNARVDESLDQYDDIRVICFIRNFETKEFAIFEEPISRFVTEDYIWSKNKSNNFTGHDKATGIHKFTWQPHGGQFTIHRQTPGSTIKFTITKNAPVLPMDEILKLSGFNEDWVHILEN